SGEMVFTSATTSVPEASAPPAPKAMSRAPDALPDSRRRGDRARAASGGSATAVSSACSFVAPGARTSSPVPHTRPPVPSTAASENGTAVSGAPRRPACTRSSVTSNDGSPLSASRWWTVPSAMSALARVTVEAGRREPEADAACVPLAARAAREGDAAAVEPPAGPERNPRAVGLEPDRHLQLAEAERGAHARPRLEPHPGARGGGPVEPDAGRGRGRSRHLWRPCGQRELPPGRGRPQAQARAVEHEGADAVGAAERVPEVDACAHAPG